MASPITSQQLHLLRIIQLEKDLSVWKLMTFQHNTLPEFHELIENFKASGMVLVDAKGKVSRLLLAARVIHQNETQKMKNHLF